MFGPSLSHYLFLVLFLFLNRWPMTAHLACHVVCSLLWPSTQKSSRMTPWFRRPSSTKPQATSALIHAAALPRLVRVHAICLGTADHPCRLTAVEDEFVCHIGLKPWGSAGLLTLIILLGFDASVWIGVSLASDQASTLMAASSTSMTPSNWHVIFSCCLFTSSTAIIEVVEILTRHWRSWSQQC